MVRVLVVSDEVVDNIALHALSGPPPDVVLSAGDLPWDYLAHLVELTGAPLLAVPGNHDPEGAPPGVTTVDCAVASVAGLRIAGLGGCVRYRSGAHQYTQEEYAVRARRLLRLARSAGPIDVVLSHAPPQGLGDATDNAHQGIAALHDVLAELQPTWHLHGHIHPYGRPMPDRRVGATIVRNVIPWRNLEIEPLTR